jgi:glucose/mannose transport system substrate-binding protein
MRKIWETHKAFAPEPRLPGKNTALRADDIGRSFKMGRFVLTVSAMAVSAVALTGAAQAEGELDILHWWTSGGELEGIKLLRENVEAQGIQWVDAASAGGAGSNARTVFRSRISAGDPPAVMQALGTEVNEWAEEGVLGDLSAVAAEEGWLDVIPGPLQEFVNIDGKVVSVPAVWSQINWVYGNKELFDTHGVTPPTSWAELEAAAETFRAAGVLPIAHGGQPWQDTAVLDGILVSMDDPEFYRKIAVEQDEDALRSDQMKEVLRRMRWFSEQLDEASPGREWTDAQAMVKNGEAAMVFMGDWGKSWQMTSGGVPDEDFICFATPGSNDMFVFLADFFFFPQLDDDADSGAQVAFAKAVMDPQFQAEFNLLKGGLPVRTDARAIALTAARRIPWHGWAGRSSGMALCRR